MAISGIERKSDSIGATSAATAGSATLLPASTIKIIAGSFTLNVSVKYVAAFEESLLGSEYPPPSSRASTSEPTTPAAIVATIKPANTALRRLTKK